MALNHHRLSLNHHQLLETLIHQENLLIIQDLDGVCMGLVKNPLSRQIDRHYVESTQQLAGHFYVLTNGEHGGSRGVNAIVEKAFGDRHYVESNGYYLPGLGGGGVQWQDSRGQVSHPGISDAELGFLAQVPAKARAYLNSILFKPPYCLDLKDIDELMAATILDNLVSPTVNLNCFYEHLRKRRQDYLQLQQDLQQLMVMLQKEARDQGLGDSFFVHYAPNLGRDHQGEKIKFTEGTDSGTTDFQFMVKGAIKEVGVLVILNHYYHDRTGHYPLGKDFNARQAPHDPQELLNLLEEHFDPAQMPTLVGVGDTVTSETQTLNGQTQVFRGGSDRGFLTLIQDLGPIFQRDNVVLYVDSSGGEVKNRHPLRVEAIADDHHPEASVTVGAQGIVDEEDPLTLNFVFPQGHGQYVDFYKRLARGWWALHR